MGTTTKEEEWNTKIAIAWKQTCNDHFTVFLANGKFFKIFAKKIAEFNSDNATSLFRTHRKFGH